MAKQDRVDDPLHRPSKPQLRDGDDCFNATITLHVTACDDYSGGGECANGTLIRRLNGCGDIFNFNNADELLHRVICGK